MRRASLAFFVLILAACSPSALVENQLTPQERSVIRGAIADIARGDTVSLTGKVPPELAGKIPTAMMQMHRAMPSGSLQITPLNANWVSQSHIRRVQAVYEVHGAASWALVDASTQSSGARTILTAIYVQQTKTKPSELNAFNLANAGPAQWGMLAAAIAAFAVTVAALIHIWRSGLFHRRWLWTIGALIGLSVLRMNWTTGQFAFQPLFVQLFSVGAVKQPIFAPWIISVSLPLVALIALLRRREPDEPEPAPSIET